MCLYRSEEDHVQLQTKTMADIRALGPCYDPAKYAPEDWTGTALDVLAAKTVPADDRIWLVTRWLDDRTNRLFAVWCARRVLTRVERPDPRSVAACDVAERFANGQATREELAAAWDAARAAAQDAAWDAARDAARAAAWAAARAAQIAHLCEMLSA
jgi:hypothetical protein